MTMMTTIILGATIGLICGQLLYGDAIRENEERKIRQKISLGLYDDEEE